jgi:membrane peptidoglycan carboxypeptidase
VTSSPAKKSRPGGTRTRPRPQGWKATLWRYRRLLLLLGVLATVTLGGLAWIVARISLPSDPPLAQTSVVLDVKGRRLAELHGEQNRVPVHLSEVAPVMQKAVVAIEDRGFYHHSGLDPRGVTRALWNDLRGRSLQGGSTITQQLVKNSYLSSQRSVVRKVREAILAVKVEQRYSKRTILERYLNIVYFGRGAYGVEAASQAYFGVAAWGQ